MLKMAVQSPNLRQLSATIAHWLIYYEYQLLACSYTEELEANYYEPPYS
jgi:hypothetical protein